MYLLYKTDAQHSYDSRDIIAAATSPINAILLAKQHANAEGEPITTEQLWNLQSFNQTQGYEGEGEYQFEHVQEDVII